MIPYLWDVKEAIANMQFQWVVSLSAVMLLSAAQAENADPMIPIELVSVAPNPDGNTASINVKEGIVYSHYTKDGNHHDFTLLEAESGRTTEFVTNANGPEVVALSDQYFAYRDGQNISRRIFVIDRTTDQKTESIRLKDPIYAGFIDGNRLVVLQGANALVFSLPQLKLEKTLPIPAGGIAARWKNGFAILGQNLTLLDNDLAPLRVIPLVRHEARGGASCGANGLNIAGQRALVLNGCGLVDTFDLTTGKLGAVIDVGPSLRPMATIGSTLFVADTPESSYRRIRAFDLDSGHFLAQREGTSNLLIAGRSRLLSLGRGPAIATSAPFTLYAPNFSAIASDAISLARIVTSCRAATNESRSVDELIDECEAAGVQRFTGRPDTPTQSHGALAQYAGLLAVSDSRYSDAIAVLDQLPQLPRSRELRILVKKKQGYFGPATDQPDSRPQPAGVRNFPLPSGLSGVDLIDNYLVVSRWDCSDNAAIGVGIDIHDRASLDKIAAVRVTDCDEEFQDSVGSIYKVGKFLLFGIDYRYGSDSRPNIGAVDIARGALVGTMYLDMGISALSVWNDMVLRCSKETASTMLDLGTLRFSPAPAAAIDACNDEHATRLHEATAADAEPKRLSTAHYEVTKNELPGGRSQLLAAQRGGVAAPARVELPMNAEFVAIPDRDALVVSSTAEGERVVSLLDLATASLSTLFRLRDASQWSAAHAWRHLLFLTRGRDLMTFDLDKRVVVDYEKNLIREGRQPVCISCNDGNDIRSIILDGDRLILQTLNGVHTRVIDLPLFTGRFRGEDFFGKQP